MNARKLLIAALFLPLALVACDDGDDGPVGPSGPVGPAGTPAPVEDPTVFKFRSDPQAAYLKVDRMGGPATTTALLKPGGAGGAARQAANLTEPKDDGQYAGEYVATLQTLHFELGPVLTAAGLAACGVPGATAAATNVDKCVGQAVSSTPAPGRVIPDVLFLDTSVASGYPNGRDLDDQVVDILLAIALLNLTDAGPTACGGGPCTTRTLAGPAGSPPPGPCLNPCASSTPPLTTFPFFNNVALAPPPAASP